MCRYCLNPYVVKHPSWPDTANQAFESQDILTFHRSVPGYRPTPLIKLPGLASKLGVKEVFVKDESHRFGLKAFKAMGASYAIYRFIKEKWEETFGVAFEMEFLYRPELIGQLNLQPFCTATDGNHGRAVAWFARLVKQKAVIYMPSTTVPARIDNIRDQGAEVVVVDGDYDEAVRRAAADTELNGWHLISDTSYPGYTKIPWWIMAGYTTMFHEIDDALKKDDGAGFTDIFFQTGVGSFAGAAAWYYRRAGRSPRLISVEPIAADCFFESIIHGNGESRSARGDQRTVMAGLNCATPSIIAWPLVRDTFDMFLAISDSQSCRAMKQYYYPVEGDPQIISGESGAAGLAALLALAQEDELAPAREDVGLGADSRILLFNTEGDTDPDNFKRIVGLRAH